jgi:hypothetical protein
MSRFSQLNGHLPLPHGKADGLLADWSVCAFSQLNTLQSCTCILAGSPTPSLRPFSQLNTWGTPELIRHLPKATLSSAALEGRVFSQLNALGRQPNSHPRSAACSQPQPVRRRPSFRDLKRRVYLHTAHEPRTTRGSVHLEPEIWRNRMK